MTILVWGGFTLLILTLLALDLGLLNRRPHVIPAREALMWTGFWVTLALSFNVLIYLAYENKWLDLGIGDHAKPGSQAALEFFTAYLVEQSLSLDNIFVIALIFSFFGIPMQYQHKVLFWGIVGVLVMRGFMIVAGMALIHEFYWVTYIFGFMLLATAVRLMISNHDDVINPDKNFTIKLVKRFVPVVNDVESGNFFTRVNGKFAVTTMFVVLMIVETTDLFFAIDSIPAVFAVTFDPFLVYTSNIFAILGLRSMYFALAAVMDKFKYLKQSLIFLLAFVGVKMLLVHTAYKIDTAVSLSIIGGILGVGVAASIVSARRDVGKALISHDPAGIFPDDFDKD